MSSAALANVVEQLRHATLRLGRPDESDGDILQRYVTLRDDVALAELIRRHGPMVFGVCRRILNNRVDAEDAFQATFLVLVRKATQIKRELLGPWLHGVARRTALCARKSLSRRRESTAEMANMPSPISTQTDEELLSVLDEQIQLLPEKYRTPVVLCELEGRSLKQVAQQSGLPEGTVASRLHRGRALLAKRMSRYSAGLSVAGICTLLAGQASAAVPNGLIQSTAKIAAGCDALAGVSSSVAQLTQGVLKLMLLTKIKTASSAVMAIVFVVGGGWALHATNALAGEPSDPPAAAKAPAEKEKSAKPVTKMQGLWNDLASYDDVTMIKAVLALAAAPKESMPLFQAELRPIKLDRKNVEKWLTDLTSDKPEVHEAAAKELAHVAPLIRDELEEAMDKAADEDTRQRLVKLIFGMPDMPIAGFGGAIVVGAAQPIPGAPGVPVPIPGKGGPPIRIRAAAAAAGNDPVPNSCWKRAIRAITILEIIGGADAQAMLTKLAEGEADAAPTKAAKEALARMGDAKK